MQICFAELPLDSCAGLDTQQTGKSKLFKEFIAALLLCIGFSSNARAQLDYLPQVGIKEFATYQHSDIDSVDLSTGNVNLHIPLVGFPQKGGKLRLNFMIRYNEPQWIGLLSDQIQVNSSNGQLTSNGIWKLQNPYTWRVLGADVVRDQGITTTDSMTPRQGHYLTDGTVTPYYSEVYGVRDRSGADHTVGYFSGVSQAQYFLAPDGSGWLPVAAYGSPASVMRDKDGLTYTSYHPSSGVPGNLSTWNISDAHGNTIEADGSGW